jgi:hypothetical protein
VAAGLALVPAAALAAGTPSFSGRTAQKVPISFRSNGRAVSNFKTNLDVFCVTAYPSSRSDIEIVSVAPKRTAALKSGKFSFKLPTVSKNTFTTVSGTIRGRTASGTLKSSFDKTWMVYNPFTGSYDVAIAACAGKTTWTVKRH